MLRATILAGLAAIALADPASLAHAQVLRAMHRDVAWA